MLYHCSSALVLLRLSKFSVDAGSSVLSQCLSSVGPLSTSENGLVELLLTGWSGNAMM